jgi:hypothetical protein
MRLMAVAGEVTISTTAFLTALALAQEHGGAQLALRATGLEPAELERVDGIPPNLGQLLAGSVPARPSPRRSSWASWPAVPRRGHVARSGSTSRRS